MIKLNKGGRKMREMVCNEKGNPPEIYDEDLIPIGCPDCGKGIKVSLRLFRLWRERGIKFKCECGRWLEVIRR